MKSRGLNTGRKYRLHLGHALSVQMVKKANIGAQVKKKTVTISFSGTFGRTMAAIGNHATIDAKAKSRRRRMVRRPWAIPSDGEAAASDVDANNGRPRFDPMAAYAEPTTTPGNVNRSGPARAPMTFANPNAVQATASQRGHVLSQVTCMIQCCLPKRLIRPRLAAKYKPESPGAPGGGTGLRSRVQNGGQRVIFRLLSQVLTRAADKLRKPRKVLRQRASGCL